MCSEPHGLAIQHYDAVDEDELSYQEGDVIELVEKVDEHWYFAANADLDMCEGLVLAKNLKIVKRLPGQDTVAGFEDGPCAVATHDFQAENPEELSFKAGDLIMLKTRYGENWFRGKLINGTSGIFPNNFVEVVEELPEDAFETPSAPSSNPASTSTSNEMRSPHGVVLFPFTAEGPGELSISEGDQVELTERIDAAWMKGKLGGKEGIFPADFINVIVDLPPKEEAVAKKTTSPPPTAAQQVSKFSTALYDFDGQEGELSFKAGDKIKMLSRVNAEWVNGEFRGAKGIFPANFVDEIPADLPDAAKEEADAAKSEVQKEIGQCEAVFDFEGNPGELSFLPGEKITILERVDQDWMKGRVGTKEGIFPVAFVKIIGELTEETVSSPKSIAQAKKAPDRPTTKTSIQSLTDDLMPKGVATADYNARGSEEISFRSGEVLYLLSKEGKDKFMGERLETGDLGIFPANCINVVVPLP